jgi:hypothetical protein
MIYGTSSPELMYMLAGKCSSEVSIGRLQIVSSSNQQLMSLKLFHLGLLREIVKSDRTSIDLTCQMNR